jgi:hypothetical protein
LLRSAPRKSAPSSLAESAIATRSFPIGSASREPGAHDVHPVQLDPVVVQLFQCVPPTAVAAPPLCRVDHLPGLIVLCFDSVLLCLSPCRSPSTIRDCRHDQREASEHVQELDERPAVEAVHDPFGQPLERNERPLPGLPAGPRDAPWLRTLLCMQHEYSSSSR